MKNFESNNLKLSDLNESEVSLINGGCEPFCYMGAIASLCDGFSRGWKSAKAGWERFLAAQ